MEAYPRALMRTMEETPPKARWEFANRNYLTDLECPPEEMNAIHQYGIELLKLAREIASGQDYQENTANGSYTSREERRQGRSASQGEQRTTV